MSYNGSLEFPPDKIFSIEADTLDGLKTQALQILAQHEVLPTAAILAFWSVELNRRVRVADFTVTGNLTSSLTGAPITE